MGQYDLFRKISQSNLTPKQRTVTQIQNDILSDFEDTPSYQSVTINNSTTPQDVQIVTATNIVSKQNYKKMLSKPLETFNVGDVVVWGSLTYLVTDIDEDKQVQTKGTIQLCNNTLSFYLATDATPILHSIPCVINNRVILNKDENKYLSTVDNQFFMMVSSNSITQQIKPNDIFQIGIYNYEIITVPDDISIPGVLIFKLKFSVVGVSDDEEVDEEQEGQEPIPQNNNLF